MRPLLGFLLLQLSVCATAADYQQAIGIAPTEYSVTGTQVDHVRFVVPADGGKGLSIAVSGKKRIVACAPRYCQSPGTRQALVKSVVLHGPTSTIAFTNGKALDLAPGSYALEIAATGVGTGKYRDNGPYSVALLQASAARRASDED